MTVMHASCGGSKNIVVATRDADLLYYQKDYVGAFDKYSQIIEAYVSKKEPVPGDLYASAGKCLFYSQSESAAMNYFNIAESLGYGDEHIVTLEMKHYAEVGNDKKELEALEKYSALYPDGSEMGYVNYRLYMKYYKAGNFRKAHLRFQNMPDEYKDDIAVLEMQHDVCLHLGRADEAGQIARQLYNLNPNNLIGLSFVAEELYNAVEEKYAAAVKAYEAKKNTANYKAMKSKTAELVPEFRRAKEYYIHLYDLYKRPHDAAILSRICTRLNEKQNAAYYDKLSKK